MPRPKLHLLATKGTGKLDKPARQLKPPSRITASEAARLFRERALDLWKQWITLFRLLPRRVMSVENLPDVLYRRCRYVKIFYHCKRFAPNLFRLKTEYPARHLSLETRGQMDTPTLCCKYCTRGFQNQKLSTVFPSLLITFFPQPDHVEQAFAPLKPQVRSLSVFLSLGLQEEMKEETGENT